MTNVIDKLKNNSIIEITLDKNSKEKYVYVKKDKKWHNATWVDGERLSVEKNDIPNVTLKSLVEDAKKRGSSVYSYPVNTLNGFKRML